MMNFIFIMRDLYSSHMRDEYLPHRVKSKSIKVKTKPINIYIKHLEPNLAQVTKC